MTHLGPSLDQYLSSPFLIKKRLNIVNFCLSYWFFRSLFKKSLFEKKLRFM